MAVGNRSSFCRGYHTTPSTAEMDATSSSTCCNYSKEESQLEALIDDRACRRETGLRGIIGAFNRKQMKAFVRMHHQALISRCVGSLERQTAGSIELALAARALGLLALTMAEETNLGLDELIKRATSHLLAQAQEHGNGTVQMAAIQSMAVLAFAGMHTEKFDVEAGEVSLLDVLWNVKDSESEEITASAVTAWCLLVTTLAPHRIPHHLELRLQELSFMAEGTSEAMRTAAGYASAIFADASPAAVEMTEDIKTVPPTAMQFKLRHGDVVTMGTWSQVLQFNFLKSFLGAGLERHMQENRLLHHVFNFIPRESKEKKEGPVKMVTSITTRKPRQHKPILEPEVVPEEAAVVVRKNRSWCRRDNILAGKAQTRVRHNNREAVHGPKWHHVMYTEDD